MSTQTPESANHEEIDALQLTPEIRALLAAAERRVIPRSQRRKWQRHLWNSIDGHPGALEAAIAFVLSFPAVSDGRRPTPEFSGFLDVLLDPDGMAVVIFLGIGVLIIFFLLVALAVGGG